LSLLGFSLFSKYLRVRWVDSSLIPVCVQIYFNPNEVDLMNSKNAMYNRNITTNDNDKNNNGSTLKKFQNNNDFDNERNNKNNSVESNSNFFFYCPPPPLPSFPSPCLKSDTGSALLPPPPPPPFPKIIFDEEFLRNEFSKYGNVVRVSLPRKIGGLLRGFAFIEFESNVSGEKVDISFLLFIFINLRQQQK
jgi:hypothetical protein